MARIHEIGFTMMPVDSRVESAIKLINIILMATSDRETSSVAVIPSHSLLYKRFLPGRMVISSSCRWTFTLFSQTLSTDIFPFSNRWIHNVTRSCKPAKSLAMTIKNSGQGAVEEAC